MNSLEPPLSTPLDIGLESYVYISKAHLTSATKYAKLIARFVVIMTMSILSLVGHTNFPI